MNKKALLAASIAIVLPIISVAQTPAVEDFSTLTKRLQAEKPKFAQRQQALLAERYDLADRSAKGTVMSRGKPFKMACAPSCPVA